METPCPSGSFVKVNSWSGLSVTTPAVKNKGFECYAGNRRQEWEQILDLQTKASAHPKMQGSEVSELKEGGG